MICKKCGHTLDNDSLFCTMCGTKTENLPEPPAFAVQPENPGVTEPDSVIERSAESFPDDGKPVQHKDMVSGAQSSFVTSGSIRYERPDMTMIGEKTQKREKEFFGTAAFVLCVSVIAMLSMTTGVFAALYFRAIGA